MHRSDPVHYLHGLEHAKHAELNTYDIAGHPTKQLFVNKTPTGINVPVAQTVQFVWVIEHYLHELAQREHVYVLLFDTVSSKYWGGQE